MKKAKEKPAAATTSNSKQEVHPSGSNNTMPASKSKVTQLTLVMDYLKKFGKITTYEAFREFGVTRLSAIIYKLKAAGVPIVSRETTGRNRYGNVCIYVEYLYSEANVNG